MFDFILMVLLIFGSISFGIGAAALFASAVIAIFSKLSDSKQDSRRERKW